MAMGKKGTREMNANELADELDDYYIAITDEYTGFGHLKDAATMLRQQQAEIEALKYAAQQALNALRIAYRKEQDSRHTYSQAMDALFEVLGDDK